MDTDGHVREGRPASWAGTRQFIGPISPNPPSASALRLGPIRLGILGETFARELDTSGFWEGQGLRRPAPPRRKGRKIQELSPAAAGKPKPGERFNTKMSQTC
jgi:hypothetical protein